MKHRFPLTILCLFPTFLALPSCGDGGQSPEATGGSDPVVGTGGAVSPASGGTNGSGGAAPTGGTAATGGAPGDNTGGTNNTGGSSPGTGGEQAVDPITFASGLDALLVDRPCESGTSLPLSNGATCLLADELHVETDVTFGGDPGTNYLVTLHVRGIWEPTKIVDGETPLPDAPLMVGGQVEPGSTDSAAVNYQQFYLEVASPEETYWLNNHGYVAHDIHKEDYEMTLLVEGGSTVKVVANDGNNRQIANFPQESFPDLPPYDQTPTLGQFLRLDVVSVEVAP